jgi:hypothetical protein
VAPPKWWIMSHHFLVVAQKCHLDEEALKGLIPLMPFILKPLREKGNKIHLYIYTIIPLKLFQRVLKGKSP